MSHGERVLASAARRRDEVVALTRAQRGCPSGGVDAWLARYAPLVEGVVVHRKVPAPRLSVVVVAWQTPEDLPICLESVARAGLRVGEVEILVVDNGGLEPARDRLRELAHVEIRMKTNVGLCPARNLGAAHARASVVCFIDDDGIVGDGALAAVLSAFEDERVVALRGRVLAKRHRYFSAIPNTYDRGERVVDTILDAEGNSAVRRDVFVESGGFGKDTPHEGADLAFRMVFGADRRIVYVPGMVLFHDFCDSWRKYLRKSTTRPRGRLTSGAEPEFVAYLTAEDERLYPKPRRPPDEAIAGFVLRNVMVSIRSAVGRVGLLRRAYIESAE